MRKTDKAARLNKPQTPKVLGGGKLGTLKQSKEELDNGKKVLKTAQKLAKNKDVKKLPQGFSYSWEKTKAENNARKKKKFAN